MAYHIPVLLHESINALQIKEQGIYVDCTFGGGGHSGEILKKLGKKGKLIAFDQDIDAKANVPTNDNRILFVHGNFRYLRNYLRFFEIEKVDGILADLGVSWHHFDMPERGFSFRFDAPLDMRMNPAADFDANTIVNTFPQEKICNIFRQYGELENAYKLSQAITAARELNPIKTTFQLVEVLRKFIPAREEHKYLAKVFQALRIEVNSEMEALNDFLLQSTNLLNTGGRLAIITYHSLEDRMVKNFLAKGKTEGEMDKDFYGNPLTPFKLISRKAILPTNEEIEQNNRARSAKLRVSEKI